MEKDVFIRYVEMIHRFEQLSKDERSIYSNTIEGRTILEVRKLVENNPDLMNLLKQIHSLPDAERKKAVEDYFSKHNSNNQEEKKEKSTEEEIAKTFGVNASEIDHKYLHNGHEIFSFYDSVSGKQVILENSKKGKSLVECLKEIQEKNEKYQTENEDDNSKSILRDKSNTENIELKFYSKNEIINVPGLDNIRGKDALILMYLLKHYEELGIKGINLDNMIYIDATNNIQEAVVVNDKVMIGKPSDAKSEGSSSKPSEEEKEETDTNELNNMVEEANEEEKKNELDKENEKEKPKIMLKQDDNKYGFISNVLLVAILSAIALIGILIYYVVQYYS